MKYLLAVMLCWTNSSNAANLLERWPDSKHEWRIVEQTITPDGKSQTVVIAVPGGIFPAAMRLQDDKTTKVTLLLNGIRGGEGISFQALKAAPAKKEVIWRSEDLEPSAYELKEVKGFQAQTRGKNYELEFTGEALELLRRGGKFQFIDFYR